MKTQQQKVAEILREQGEIDNFSAIDGTIGFRCLRLGAIIHRLRQEGWVIDTKVQADKNTMYVLREAPKQRKIVIVGGQAIETWE